MLYRLDCALLAGREVTVDVHRLKPPFAHFRLQ
jgi:hypothetical protein